MSHAVAESPRRPITPMLGHHSTMTALRQAITAAAQLDVPILIEGPTGAGKELVASQLHAEMQLHAETQPKGRLVALNVTALAESLVDVELFGADRGAYTGASSDRMGLIELAANGTLFLDEAGDLPLAVQAKLLRVLELGAVRRVGGARDRQIPFRLILSLQRPASELVESRRWREDFFFRVAGLVLRVPALRDRASDIPLLAAHYLVGLGRPALAPSIEARLMEYHWPGNVRELRRVIERAVFSAGSHAIESHHITAAMTAGQFGQLGSGSPGRTLDEVERRHIQSVLRELDYDVASAARILGLSSRSLYRRLVSLGISTSTARRQECHAG